MNRMPLNKLGPRELPGRKVAFGIYLPWIAAGQGYRLRVKIIHEKDQFLKAIAPKVFELQHSMDMDERFGTGLGG